MVGVKLNEYYGVCYKVLYMRKIELVKSARWDEDERLNKRLRLKMQMSQYMLAPRDMLLVHNNAIPQNQSPTNASLAAQYVTEVMKGQAHVSTRGSSSTLVCFIGIRRWEMHAGAESKGIRIQHWIVRIETMISWPKLTSTSIGHVGDLR
jgi:hypothetical protein